jgi:hypothetical protein
MGVFPFKETVSWPTLYSKCGEKLVWRIFFLHFISRIFIDYRNIKYFVDGIYRKRPTFFSCRLFRLIPPSPPLPRASIGCPTEYIFYCKRRAILFLSSSKILTPHPPLHPASVYPPPPPPPLLRGEDRLAGRREMGGSIFWKKREIGLPSYSKICTLWATP